MKSREHHPYSFLYFVFHCKTELAPGEPADNVDCPLLFFFVTFDLASAVRSRVPLWKSFSYNHKCVGLLVWARLHEALSPTPARFSFQTNCLRIDLISSFALHHLYSALFFISLVCTLSTMCLMPLYLFLLLLFYLLFIFYMSLFVYL